MEKNLVPYKQSLDMKSIGFDELCFGFYDDLNNNKPIGGNFPCDGRNSAPLYQQCFRCFREKHSLNSFIIDSKSYNWYFNINDMVKDDVISEVLYFNTYEEAELECLIKLIEIVKENK